MSENTVAKLMAGQHLAARRKKRRKGTTRPGRGRWRAPDLVRRDFPARQLNRKWFGDGGTEIPTAEGKLHLVSVMDVASRRVLGFTLAERHDSQMAYGALAMALAVRGGQASGVIFHTCGCHQPRPRSAHERRVRFRRAASPVAERQGPCPDRQDITTPAPGTLIRLNQIMRGWANCFRHAVYKHTLGALDDFIWHRVIRWQMKQHRWNWKDVRRWLTGPPRPVAQACGGRDRTVQPHNVPVTRYLYRGSKIPNPWSGFNLT